MRRSLILLSLLLLLPVVGRAQPTPQILFEHDGANLTSFKCVVDPATTNTITDLGIPSKTGTTYSVDITACTGVMVNGTHSLVIQACNAVGCTSATAITVVKL